MVKSQSARKAVFPTVLGWRTPWFIFMRQPHGPGVSNVLLLLGRQYATVKAGAYGIGGRIPPARLKHALDYIESHIDQQTHLSDLAQTASMSLFYFARLFKNSMGVSPHRYVAMRRIERAKEMLRRSDRSVFEIGLGVGCLDAKHFRVRFHREVGVSPSEFRASQS